MKNISIVPQPDVIYTGQTVNGRLIGDYHRDGRYWKWDWSCPVHNTISVVPMRMKDILLRQGPRCCYKVSGDSNPNWRGHKTLSMKKFNQIVGGAKKRDIEFNVSIEYLWSLWDKDGRVCPYSGRELPNPSAREASLDRISSARGYVPGNVEWVHIDVNLAKQQLSRAEFVRLCQDVANNRPIVPLEAHAMMPDAKVYVT